MRLDEAPTDAPQLCDPPPAARIDALAALLRSGEVLRGAGAVAFGRPVAGPGLDPPNGCVVVTTERLLLALDDRRLVHAIELATVDALRVERAGPRTTRRIVLHAHDPNGSIRLELQVCRAFAVSVARACDPGRAARLAAARRARASARAAG